MHASHVAEPKCMQHGVHSKKRVHSLKRVHGTIEKEQAECMRHGSHGQKRIHGQKRVHGTIKKEEAKLATSSPCITYGAAAKLRQVTW